MTAKTLAEFETLRVALMHWRFKLSDRLCNQGVETCEALRIHRELVIRHHAVLTEK